MASNKKPLVTSRSFPEPSKNKRTLEEGATFTPKFDDLGLIPAIVTDETGNVLMFAYMNTEALQLSVQTREAHFWSRSRNSLWRKGETSGNVLHIIEIRTDCDQDVVWLKVKLDGVACHTGERSCFYRKIEIKRGRARLQRLDD